MSHFAPKTLIAMLMAIAAGVASCVQPQQQQAKQQQADSTPAGCEPPEWFVNPAITPGLYIGLGLGIDNDRRMAERKAIMQANIDLAKRITATNNHGTLPTVAVAHMDVAQNDGQYCIYVMVQAKQN